MATTSHKTHHRASLHVLGVIADEFGRHVHKCCCQPEVPNVPEEYKNAFLCDGGIELEPAVECD